MLTSQQLKDKIHANVLIVGDCWEWQLSRLTNGYGRISIGNQKQDYAHRVSHTVFNGEIPNGLVVRHRCDNPCCCNPDHLEAGTHKENTRDSLDRGRFAKHTLFTKEKSSGENNVKSKLKVEDVLAIRDSPLSRKQLAEAYKVDANTIGHILNRKTWRNI